MKVAIHQPNFLPWFGYFLKMYLCDHFVFHDMVKFSKSGFTSRVKILGDEVQWIGLPTDKKEHLIKDQPLRDPTAKISQNYKSIEQAYNAAPYWNQVKNLYERLFENANDYSNIAELNIYNCLIVCEMLGVSVDCSKSSNYEVHGKSNDLNLEILSALGAHTYLSGTGAKAYQDETSFESAGIELVYVDSFNYLESNPYDQGITEFYNGLSIIDTIAHLGLVGTYELLERYSSRST